MNRGLVIAAAAAAELVSVPARATGADAGVQRDAGPSPVQCTSKENCLEKARALDKGARRVIAGGKIENAAKDYETAASYYERACHLGAGSACTRLGVLASTGVFSAADEKRALALYEKGCGSGDAEGCDVAGNTYYQGRRNGAIARDYEKAAVFYEKGCALGEGGSCHTLGNQYSSGKGVKRDKKRAKALHKRAKELGFEIPD
jgi:TPR repeat protein